MRRILRVLALLAASGLVAGAVFVVPTIWGRPWSIEHFYTRVFAELVLSRPELLSRLRILEPWGLRWHNDDLDDYSVAFTQAESERLRRNLRTLREYPLEEQTPAQRFSTRVLDWFLAVQVDGEPFRFHDFPLNQFTGIQAQLPDFLLNIHQIHDARDARDYVTRLSKVGLAIDQVIEASRFRAERGIVPPPVILDRVQQSVERFLAAGVDDNPLHREFARRVAALENLSDRERADLQASARTQVERSVRPAWQRLAAFLPELEAQAPEAVGAWALPDGSLYYGWALRFHTTTDLDADTIHRLGLAEVARIHEEMRAILAAEDLAADDLAVAGPHDEPASTVVPPDLGDVLRALHRDERFLYPDGDEARSRILADYQAIVDEASTRLPALFGRLPQAPVRVERVPAFKEAGAAGAYYMPPPLDGSKPGIFYANLRQPDEVVQFGMRTLAYHEAVPGHHLQIALAQEMQGVPFFRRVIPFTAFIEGWALYAERLAAEQGWHPTPMDRLGQLVAEGFRAARLVVDTGLHAKRWTREQAIDYMLRNTGMPETDVVAEVERYIVLPGQACAYKVGQLRLLELRERAQAAQRERFDLRAFHDLVLANGSLPLVLLEETVDAWLATP
ncbi:DUF885 family protein [Myxococcota bacterium]|nr:DUF885 family protein [Myxococcota bacterium]MCZ7617966.1 DUF885 domain-containing protein [Myxococcota bacterium]